MSGAAAETRPLVHVFQGKDLRTLVQGDQELFHAKDVVEALGYKKKAKDAPPKKEKDTSAPMDVGGIDGKGGKEQRKGEKRKR